MSTPLFRKAFTALRSTSDPEDHFGGTVQTRCLCSTAGKIVPYENIANQRLI